MTQYQINQVKITETAKIISPVMRHALRDFELHTFRNQHPTAHLRWFDKDESKVVYARLTNSCKWRPTADGLDGARTLDIALPMYMERKRYKILDTVDFLVLVYSNLERDDYLNIVIVDSKRLFKCFSTFVEGGNEALAGLGVCAYRGQTFVEYGLMAEWGCIKQHFHFNPKNLEYTDGVTNKTHLVDTRFRKLIGKIEIPRAKLSPRPIAVFHRDSKTVQTYDSISKAVWVMWKDHLEKLPDRQAQSKEVSKLAVKFSRCLAGDCLKVKDATGDWFTVFDSGEWIDMVENRRDDLKTKLQARFKKAIRKVAA